MAVVKQRIAKKYPVNIENLHGTSQGQRAGLGNLVRLAPALLSCSTVPRGVVADDQRRVNRGHEFRELGRGGWLQCGPAQSAPHQRKGAGPGRDSQLPANANAADMRELEWGKGLTTLATATLVCVRDGKETVETRYYISTLPRGVKQFSPRDLQWRGE